MRIALGSLRRHRSAYLGTFLAAVLAIALVAAAGLLLWSVLVANPPANRFAAAAAVVPGPRAVTLHTTTTKHGKVKTKIKSERLSGAGTLSPDLVPRIASAAGVKAAIADHAFPIALSTPDGRPVDGAARAPIIGHGWASARLTPYTLRAGRPPATSEVVIDQRLAAQSSSSIDDEVVVTTRTGVRRMRIAGIATPVGHDGLAATERAVFFADCDVRPVSGLDGPTAIGLLARSDADLAALVTAVRARTGGAPVLTGADRMQADAPTSLPDYIGPISTFGFMIGITAVAAAFVLTSTVALGVRQRLRELALLRTAGATPRQLGRLLGLGAIALAAAASLPALPLGVVIAQAVAARFRALGAVPAQFTLRLDVPVLAAAAATGIAVTFVAARIAGRRSVRIAPTQALVETATEPDGARVARGLLAAVTVTGATAILALVPLDGPVGIGMSFLSCVLLLCAVVALGPVLVRVTTAAAGRLAATGEVTGWLAATLARAESQRVAAVAVPLVLMFALNATMVLTGSLLSHLTSDEHAARVGPATAQMTDSAGLPLPVVDAVVALRGVTGAAATVPTRVITATGGKPEDHLAQGLLTVGREPALDLDVRDGALGGDSTFAASARAVAQRRWRIGDEVSMWLADGQPVTLTLAAVYTRARGFGDLVLPARLVAAHDPRGLASAVALRYTGDVAARIHARWPTMRLARPAAAAPAGDASNQQGSIELLVVISFAFTAIAVVNTFAIDAAARRHEFASLRLAGATVRQVHRMVDRQTAITVAVGLLLGAVVAGVVVGMFSTAQDGVFRLIVDPAAYATMLGGSAALGLTAGAVPVRLVLRRHSLPAGDDMRAPTVR
jgi:putative ABC transport system permease protein